MPFSGNTYTLVTGASTAAAGQVVQSAVWNNIHNDIATALTTLMTQANTSQPGWQNILVANGGFPIWQRGTSISVGASTTAYTADRWYLTTGANQASTVSASTDLVSGANNHCAKIQRTAAETGTTEITFGYPLTTEEVNRLRGSYISFTCSVKTGANWSPTNGTLTVALYVGTGTEGKRGAGFTGETEVFLKTTNFSVSSAVTSITKTSAGVVPATSTQGELQFRWTPVGVAGADDSIYIDSCCMSLGSIQLYYTDIPFPQQLTLCQRFYRKTFNYATTPAQGAGLSGALATISQGAARCGIYWQFDPIPMRATASCVTYNPMGASANWQNVTSTTSNTVTVDTSAGAGPGGVFIYSATATATDNFLYIQAIASAGL